MSKKLVIAPLAVWAVAVAYLSNPYSYLVPPSLRGVADVIRGITSRQTWQELVDSKLETTDPCPICDCSAQVAAAVSAATAAAASSAQATPSTTTAATTTDSSATASTATYFAKPVPFRNSRIVRPFLPSKSEARSAK